MPNDRPPKPPLGLTPPRAPKFDERKEPESHRRSADSFGPLNDDDRELLQRVLVTAQTAIDESRAAREAAAADVSTLEGKFTVFKGEASEKFAELEGAVSELRGIGGDIKGLRGDFSTLNASVMQNLNMDAVRDERTRALENKVAAIAIDEGRSAGKSAGARWGVVGGLSPAVVGLLVWIIAALIAAFQGRPAPAFPGVPTPQPTLTAPVPAPTSSK